jgi:hypothetical protein
MFSFFKNSQPHHPTNTLAQALAKDGLPPGMDPMTLGVLEQRGSYSGRRVTYFRVFDPIRVAERSVQVRTFADLDSRPEFVLGSGHREQDGAIVLSRQTRPASASVTTSVATAARANANRSDHADDEQFVFPDRIA